MEINDYISEITEIEELEGGISLLWEDEADITLYIALESIMTILEELTSKII